MKTRFTAFNLAIPLLLQVGYAKTPAHQKTLPAQPKVAYLPPRPATPDEIEKVRAALKLKLKDDVGARYASVEVAEQIGGYGGAQICGLVNAKNGFGAYAGYVPFNTAWMVFPPETNLAPRMIVINLNDDLGISTCHVCSMYGIRLP